MAAPAAEETEIPSWLSNEFFQNTLESDFPGIQVRSSQIEPAVAVGENFVCIVYRAIVGRAEGADLPLIIKVLPSTEFKAQMVRDGEFTVREVRMYKETLHLLGDPCNHPKCFYAKLDNVRDAVVLEDLRPKGYKTRDRKLGLDLIHAKLVMEQIGKLHGSGIALR
jgi:Ecdysteroid kinase-like family